MAALHLGHVLGRSCGDDLAAAVTGAGVATDAIVLEVTEGDLADHLDEAVTSLSGLRAQGFRTAIDDFGTGHSSLARLQELPVDVLKLDQAFLRGAHADPYRILSPIIELAHRLEFSCVAEGVETAEHLRLLGELGCDRAQGYLFSRPVPLDDALERAGLTAPYEPGNLLGIADDPDVKLDKSLHQTWIAVDEDGVEAAAATIVLVVPASRPIEEPIPVVADRPFFLRIVDARSAAMLFVGQVTNPAA